MKGRSRPATINRLIVEAIRRAPRPHVLGYKKNGNWIELSHAELLESVKLVALGLHSLGVRKGDLVLLLAENCYEWILADLGTLMCGAVDVPLYHSMTASQVEFIARETSAQFAFVSEAYQLAKLESSRDVASALRQIILFRAKQGNGAANRTTTMEALMELGRQMADRQPGLFDRLWQEIQAEDPATLIYTSGTTGTPKGVWLSHGNIAANVQDAIQVLNIDGPSHIALSYLPFSHVLERNNIYGYINAGILFYLAESLALVTENLKEVRPTLMTSVPRMFEKIYHHLLRTAASGSHLRDSLIHWSLRIGRLFSEHKDKGAGVPFGLLWKYQLAWYLVLRHWRHGMGGRIQFFISGGAPLSPEIAHVFQSANIPILQGYGLTETSPIVSLNTLQHNRIGTVGRPLPGTMVSVAEDGEILVRGPGVTRGYFRRDEENRSAFTDGWFRTGDLGYLDKDGYLLVTDRKKDLIKTSGGKYVTPLPIENSILGSRFINQVVVVGNERKFPAALVVPDEAMLRSYAGMKGIVYKHYLELLRHPQILNLIERQVAKYTEELPQHEKIKKVILMEKEFSVEGGELTLTMKVKRRDLERKYQQLIDEIYRESALG
jgi:long-chain acyl-CoA synthetase